MNNFIFLDSVWKCLFALSTTVSLILAIALLGYASVQKKSSSEKSKGFLNSHLLFAFLTTVLGALTLTQMDPELIAGCFNKFAITSNSYTITRLLAGGYLMVVGVIFFKDAAQILISYRYHQKLSKLEDHPINILVENLKIQLGIQSPIHILKNESASSPYVWGLVTHRLVVNSYLLNSHNIEQVRSILTHELMHIKGQDTAWVFLGHVLKRLFFFNPLCYLFCRKQSLAVEMAADEKSIRCCHINPKVLLHSIVEMAELGLKNRQTLLQVHASRDFTEIKQRMEALAGKPESRKWTYAVTFASCLFLSLAATAIQAQAFLKDPTANKLEERMCMQVRHERVIENWLRIESTQDINKCEMN